MKLIGLLDYEALFTHRYYGPNYDIGLTYGYLRKDPNISTRLIISLADKNLTKYDEIWIFKISPHAPHPRLLIPKYYVYNIKEFGPGFNNKEWRPYAIETLYDTPDFSCYNPILKYSMEHPHSRNAWWISPLIQKHHYKHKRLYEYIEGEWLRRDMISREKWIMIHDSPTTLLTHEDQFALLNSVCEQAHVIYSQKLDISQITDTTILERVAREGRWASMRTGLFISHMNTNALWFMDCYAKYKRKGISILVSMKEDETDGYYLRYMLELNHCARQYGYKIFLHPYQDILSMLEQKSLAVYAYRFLFKASHKMSFYEYMFYASFAAYNIPKALRKTAEGAYEYLLTQYGMPPLLQKLERWMDNNPDMIDYVFIGGTSRYEEIRARAYNPKAERMAFTIRDEGEK